MTYKENVLELHCLVGPVALFSLAWPYLCGYALGSSFDHAVRRKVYLRSALMCGLGTLFPIIPMVSAASGQPLNETYAASYRFFRADDEGISLPSETGKNLCFLLTVIPVLPVLVLASLVVTVPPFFLLAMLIECIAYPLAAIADVMYPELEVSSLPGMIE